jgi:hypothetical protein
LINAGIGLYGFSKLILDLHFSKYVLSVEIREELSMTETEKEALIRQYAAGEITWHSLRERGFENYVQVLGALGELGLRPPVAPMEGPNREARERGRAIIRDALQAHR